MRPLNDGRSPKAPSERMVAALLALLLAATAFAADTITVFGPKTYRRGKGKPVRGIYTFQVAGTSLSYTLRIRNGQEGHSDHDGNDGDDDGGPVSSAVVTLNGTQVLGPSDFSR